LESKKEYNGGKQRKNKKNEEKEKKEKMEKEKLKEQTHVNIL